MKCEHVFYNDLVEIRNLRPEKWPDIVPDFELYVKSEYCNPIKIKEQDKIVGIGTSILFDKTSWIAHIIVDKSFRQRGIGSQIVHNIMADLCNNAIDTCSLIATELGKPIYKKAGFRVVTEYTFLIRDKPWLDGLVSINVKPYIENYRLRILELDKRISGENREWLISLFISNSVVYIKNDVVQGFYLPDFKEGLIFADSDEAGLELMKYKYSKIDKAVLPSDNIVGVNYLKHHGFVEASVKGTRMIYGKNIDWNPKNIFSRIGGNFG